MISKILFIGPMGAGKTTAITAVSDSEPITTEADNLDRAQSDKATTTVALDYGEIYLDEDSSVLLYGMPGQDRFDFMWPILAEGALGAVLLLDHSHPDAVAQLDHFLEAFAALVSCGALVVGVGRVQNSQDIGVYQAHLKAKGLALPVYATDVRHKQNVLLLIETLIANAELNEILER
ncbi:ATP/GTP-binding protein [Pseudomonas asuensis]|uniref:GTP-binding protein n=1 Tax=Pseudomonas asuensis TaxID=1825787 RepID=A0ABQ2GWW6_9PSED|nr:ATP/GTP-binding protein [Pseudomonas asuensis]GGM15226.1 GTP-binding protein [Pseudomonas asuensis]